MYKSYFYLLRAAQELSSILQNKKLLECYTQERDKLFLHIPIMDFPHFHLLISTNAQEFHFYFKIEQRKAKKNTANFFTDFLPQKIEAVKIALGERIIVLEMETGRFYILFRGNKSNCFFSDTKNQLHTFKKVSGEQLTKLKHEFSQLSLISTSETVIERISKVERFDELKALPYLSKDILKIAEAKEHPANAAVKIIEEIVFDKIAVGIDKKTGEAIFSPISMLDSNKEMNLELFENYFDAVTNYFSLKRTTVKTHDSKLEIEKFLGNELEKITSKLNKLKTRIENGSKEAEYKRNGEALLSAISAIKKGSAEITVSDWKSNSELKIKIDPKLSAQQNINYHFDKARSEKLEYEKSTLLYKNTKDRFERLITFREKLSIELTTEQLQEIKKELKMNMQQNSTEEKKEKLPFRHFIIEGKYHFYIGKDGKNNDVLTTKFAKQNDFWFHARSVAGSHGVLRVENTKEAIPKRVLEKAASITAFYSKSKTSKLAPVTYTLKKYVTKNSRHEVGQVSVMKENVLLVRPEIPADCEYIED
ncbi:MAG: putative RNA-binding protein [Ignavibacteria bacterium]|nr:MAG: putative RNA-binding protein [Ignavibacteria bacterium]KAF0162064.1 MAG: putative RNA-binding protein [Ignavibacteria bacterium]